MRKRRRGEGEEGGGERGGGRVRLGRRKKSRSPHMYNLLLYTYSGTQYIFML